MPSTTGQRIAAQAQAVPVVLYSGMSVALPMESFSVPFNGGLVFFVATVRKQCEQGLKAIVLATGKDVMWES